MMAPKHKSKVSKLFNKNKSKSPEKSRHKKNKELEDEKQMKRGRPSKDSPGKAKKRISPSKGDKKEFNSRKNLLTALGRARETLEEKLEKQAEDENHLLEAHNSGNDEQHERKFGRSSEGLPYGASCKAENNDEKKHSKRLPSSPQQSPRKAGFAKVNRKRKRKEDASGSEAGQYHYTYVMKLFDRSVDLAQFSENTSLYPICRAWIKNQPYHAMNEERSPSPGSDIDIKEKEKNIQKNENVYTLPPPIKTEKDHIAVPRIPSPIPQTSTKIDIYADPDKAPNAKELMSNHMARWKKVRNKWKEASHQNELRFSPSLIILKEMFDSQCKDS